MLFQEAFVKTYATYRTQSFEYEKVESIDRFEKFARLGTSLLISDAIISISATMRGKRTSDDLEKSMYRFEDANRDYANSAIARIFSISESTLRGILKRRIGQKKVKLGQKSVQTAQKSCHKNGSF